MFVVGANKHRTTELITTNKWKWSIMDPYPNVRDINSVKIVSYEKAFYVFGGYADGQVTSDILGFENESWSRVGSFTEKRIKFSVILNVDKVFVIGGQKKQKYEVCTLSNTVNCEQDSSLDFQGSEEPVLFGVSKNGSCDLTFSKYNWEETKELMILSNATFEEVDNFLSVRRTNYRSDKYIYFLNMKYF